MFQSLVLFAAVSAKSWQKSAQDSFSWVGFDQFVYLHGWSSLEKPFWHDGRSEPGIDTLLQSIWLECPFFGIWMQFYFSLHFITFPIAGVLLQSRFSLFIQLQNWLVNATNTIQDRIRDESNSGKFKTLYNQRILDQKTEIAKTKIPRMYKVSNHNNPDIGICWTE